MTALHPIGIIGTGTMGAGIAQVAAIHGFTVQLMDVDEARVLSAIASVREKLDRMVEKGKLSEEERDAAAARLRPALNPQDLADCDLIIEAIIESLDAKTTMFKQVLPYLRPDAIIASNTSSLSISAIGDAIGQPHRVVGMHFFNPAPLMPLVEVISGKRSDPKLVQRVVLIAEAWGKTVARANDTPGFIVNRVARPYYLEAWRILEDRYAGVDEIDEAMRSLGGFRMGPLELTDLIGQDVNTSTTESVWQQLGKSSRLSPSAMQMQLVKEGHLGRKTGRGAYIHDGSDPRPAIAIEKRDLKLSDRLTAAIERFVSGATDQIGAPLEQYILARVLVAVINEAGWALAEGVSDRANIDTAMKLGTNYPKGPLEWAEQIGYAVCGELLDALNETVQDNRFAAPEVFKVSV
ncbi:MAG TPA: 3-hydroxyacyl-CoA dehydrogenase NAD-binding domain-containing protein [Phycisphaerales bacterium]|nr:3-hydroxyacyl-CoA dehydrogenase NAD-binding domain-containing protein [Phycisphaerales bacterium]HRQ75163.1 3-hydroxyacyl-CoA dehydrogenase NAD-binding domain-containing protein [Phycisphaerales bacterium]